MRSDAELRKLQYLCCRIINMSKSLFFFQISRHALQYRTHPLKKESLVTSYNGKSWRAVKKCDQWQKDSRSKRTFPKTV